MPRINPPLASENPQPNPIHRVTGLFSSPDAVPGVVKDLEDAGFVGDAVELFAGQAGEKAFDVTGEATGPMAQVYRTLERWMSDTAEAHERAAEALRAGGVGVAVVVGTDEALKKTAMNILTRHGAREVRYWSRFYVEES